MIDKIFDLGETTVREVMVPAGGRGGAARRPPRPHDAVAPDPGARLLAHPVFTERVIQHGRRRHRAWTSSGRGAQVPDVRALMRRPTYVPGDQAHRRPAARDAEGPHPARGGGGRVRRRGRHRDASRTSSSRSWARSRTSTTAPRPPSSGCPTAATAWRAAPASTSSTRRSTGSCPRSDFETVAGLVLATLAPHPRGRARCSRSRGYTFTVLEADERRVAR